MIALYWRGGRLGAGRQRRNESLVLALKTQRTAGRTHGYALLAQVRRSVRFGYAERRDAPGGYAPVLPDVPAGVLRRDLRDQPVDAAGIARRRRPRDAAVDRAAGGARGARALGCHDRVGGGAAGHGVRGQRRDGDRRDRARRAVQAPRARGRGRGVPVLVSVARVLAGARARLRERGRG